MRYFVTGASGFIGRNLVWYLAKNNEFVKIILRKKEDERFFSMYKNISIIFGGLEDLKEKDLKDIDIVYHLAARRGGVKVSLEDYRYTNVYLTKILLDLSVKNNVKKFVFCSSVSVMGHIKIKPADETYGYNPATKYGISKMEAEKLVITYGKNMINTTIIRPVITYGPEDEWGMLTKLIRLIYNHKYATVGNGNNTVHLCYIDDMIQGLIKGANVNKSNGT